MRGPETPQQVLSCPRTCSSTAICQLGAPLCQCQGRVQKKNRKKYGLLPNHPRTPPPELVIFPDKKLTIIFFQKSDPHWVKQIFHLVPSQNLFFLLFYCSLILAFFPPGFGVWARGSNRRFLVQISESCLSQISFI